MPILAAFFGIFIRVFHDDHNPPHFHAAYGEFDAIIEISSGKILHGKMPRRVRRLIEEWRKLRLVELKKAWQEAITGQMPRRIKPLE